MARGASTPRAECKSPLTLSLTTGPQVHFISTPTTTGRLQRDYRASNGHKSSGRLVPSADFLVLIISSLFVLASVNENFHVYQGFKNVAHGTNNADDAVLLPKSTFFHLTSIVQGMGVIAKNASILFILYKNGEQSDHARCKWDQKNHRIGPGAPWSKTNKTFVKEHASDPGCPLRLLPSLLASEARARRPHLCSQDLPSPSFRSLPGPAPRNSVQPTLLPRPPHGP